VGIIFVLLVIAIPAYGYYSSYVAPARAVAAQVGNATITMGDVVKQLRALQAMGSYSEPQSIASAPQEVLVSLVENEMVYQSALKQGITATEAEVSLAIQTYFYPYVSEDEEVSPADLEREYRENYRSFLDTSGLSDAEFRQMTKYSVVSSKMTDRLSEQVPNQAAHVEAHWIAIPYGMDFNEASQKLKDGEDFASVCAEYNSDNTYTSQDCYVGWIPEGAFTSLDEILFSIERDTVSEPFRTNDGYYIVKITDGPEVRDITAPMKQKLEQEAYSVWTLSLWDEYRATDSINLTFNSERDAWARQQMRIAQPTPTPTLGL
jgi:foldase protein PrsA